MKTTMSLLCLALLAVTMPAHAAYRSESGVPAKTSSSDILRVISEAFSPLGRVSSSQNKEPEDKKAYVLIDYAVPPSKQDEFISAFEKTAGLTKKEEGSIVYTLSRTVDENLSFYLYSEWSDMKAVGEHFNASYLKDYLETIAELNVVWKLHVLTPVVY